MSLEHLVEKLAAFEPHGDLPVPLNHLTEPFMPALNDSKITFIRTVSFARRAKRSQNMVSTFRIENECDDQWTDCRSRLIQSFIQT
jgi:hypothetical protein